MQDETLPTFEAVQKLLFDFESTLEHHGITIESGSQLEQIGLAIVDLLIKKKEPALVGPSEDARSYFASILGLRAFMTKVVAMKDHRDFRQLLPHLRKMNSGQVPQNVPSGILDRVSPKHFELLIALAAMRIGTNLELDDPDESSGGLNPDVMITVGGIRYGLACKALFGSSSQALTQNLEKGIDQIERSPADLGFVILNIKDLINHNVCWPSPQDVDFPDGQQVDSLAWPDLDFVLAYLNGLATKRVLDMEQLVGVIALHNMFKGKKAIPVVVHLLHTATALTGPKGPVATTVLYLHHYGYGATVISKLNGALQDHEL